MFYATIYISEHKEYFFNHLPISNDDVTPEILKSVMIYIVPAQHYVKVNWLILMDFGTNIRLHVWNVENVDEIGCVDVEITAK